MTVVAILPIVFAVLGAVVYLASSNAKACELGRITFAVGMLVLVAAMAGHVIRVG